MNAMLIFILGLTVFFASHSIRIFADGWRSAMLARLGELRWKGLISLLSLAGFALLLWGYAQVRAEPPALWTPASWSRLLVPILTLPAFVLVVAAYVPGNRFKTALGHPMLAGTILWALAHLPGNGGRASTVLFGSFLVWALISFAASRRRDRAEGRVYPPGPAWRTAVVVIVGVAAWAVFATVLHGPLIGIRP